MGIVVINELPERRDTLLLRLMGAGPTLRRAIDELTVLPENALERQVMLPLLLKYRLQIEADPDGQTAEDKEFLMSTQDALALWEEKVRKRERRRAIKEGIKQGIAPARRLLLALYETRFGPVPSAVRTRVEVTSHPKVMMAWSELVATAPREEVDRAFGAS